VNDAPRYAIYFVPRADSALYRLGRSLLGYDCYAGTEVEHPRGAGLPDDWADLTAEPRRYGFHATLKAPFRLAAGCDEAAVLGAMREFARMEREVPAIQPAVRTIGPFIAVLPRHADAALDRLAADCVVHFDRFRAAPSPEERARRLASPLNERQRANVDRWGYPYVFEDFRFHMTLTGPIREERRMEIVNVLADLFARAEGANVRIDRISLLRQSGVMSRFRVVRDLELIACDGRDGCSHAVSTPR